MQPRSAALLVLLGSALAAPAADKPRLITYDNLPLGSADAPLVLRTYFPDPDLDPAVLAHHHVGGPSPRYNPNRGEDVPGEFQPVKGIPAAVGVNHGPTLSYVFDTTEGRMLYAWQGGFVDMFPYWGDEERGNRQSFNYTPALVGTLFYKAAGKHPVEIGGRSVSDLGAPSYVGYDVAPNRQPTFIVRFGEHTVRTRVNPIAGQLALRMEISVEPAAPLSYRSENPQFVLKQEKLPNGGLAVTLTGVSLGTYQGYPRRHNIKEANAAAGEELYKNYGCVTCHSIDGSLGHGPTFGGLFDRDRPLVDGRSVKVDDAYLLESIKTPNAKIAQGFPPNYMPPYNLQEIEYQSLVLFIKSLHPE